ncbi:hypothetical protein OF83DRAFT_1042067, partial [Amylostereum chailletii]
SRLAHLAGFKPRLYDCCINSCCCFTGPLEDEDKCPKCNEPRYKSNGRGRKHFTYLPVIPRLTAFMASQPMAERLQYRAKEHEHTPDDINDVFDGTHYHSLCKEKVVVDGKKLLHRYFQDSRDMALGVTTDGFAPFRRRKST